MTGLQDPTLLGNFLEDQDVPRWANISVDPQSMWNAMVFSFMSDGIPIVYYGQEQGFHGNADPVSQSLWHLDLTDSLHVYSTTASRCGLRITKTRQATL